MSNRPDRSASGSLKLLFQDEFDDMASFGEAVAWPELDFRQLEAGPLRARAAVLTADCSLALRVGFDRRFHQRGIAPRGFVSLGLPDHDGRVCGVVVRAGDVVNFNLPSGFDATSPAGFSGTILSLDPELLAQAACELGLSFDVRGHVSSAPAWTGGRETQLLRQRLAGAFARAARGAAEGASAVLEMDAAAMAVRVLSRAGSVVRPLDPTPQRRLVRIALDMLEDPDRLPLRVADLCRATDVSAPTLFRAFRDELGVSPKHYIRSRSLSGVRRDLLEAPPGSRVVDIANRWGYWHMGQFAADYRRQFGELPSETLGRSVTARAGAAGRTNGYG